MGEDFNKLTKVHSTDEPSNLRANADPSVKEDSAPVENNAKQENENECGIIDKPLLSPVGYHISHQSTEDNTE